MDVNKVLGSIDQRGKTSPDLIRTPYMQATVPHPDAPGTCRSKPTGHLGRSPFHTEPLGPACRALCRQQKKQNTGRCFPNGSVRHLRQMSSFPPNTLQSQARAEWPYSLEEAPASAHHCWTLRAGKGAPTSVPRNASSGSPYLGSADLCTVLGNFFFFFF